MNLKGIISLLTFLAFCMLLAKAGRYIEINEYRDILEMRNGKEKIAFEAPSTNYLNAAFILRKSAEFPVIDLYEDASRYSDIGSEGKVSPKQVYTTNRV